MSKEQGRRGYLAECTCPVCKKIFVPAPLHVYKAYHKQTPVCSYKCSLESERKELERMAKAKERRNRNRKKGVKEQ